MTTIDEIKKYVAFTKHNTNPNQIESMINDYAESNCKLFVTNLKTANPPILNKKFSEIVDAKNAEKTIIYRQYEEPDIILTWNGTEFTGSAVLSYTESSVKIKVVTITESAQDKARISTNVIEVNNASDT